MTVLYPNLCYNEACYKGAALFLSIESIITIISKIDAERWKIKRYKQANTLSLEGASVLNL